MQYSIRPVRVAVNGTLQIGEESTGMPFFDATIAGPSYFMEDPNAYRLFKKESMAVHAILDACMTAEIRTHIYYANSRGVSPRSLPKRLRDNLHSEMSNLSRMPNRPKLHYALWSSWRNGTHPASSALSIIESNSGKLCDLCQSDTDIRIYMGDNALDLDKFGQELKDRGYTMAPIALYDISKDADGSNRYEKILSWTWQRKSRALEEPEIAKKYGRKRGYFIKQFANLTELVRMLAHKTLP